MKLPHEDLLELFDLDAELTLPFGYVLQLEFIVQDQVDERHSFVSGISRHTKNIVEELN